MLTARMYLSMTQFLTHLATILRVASCSAQVIGLPSPVSCVAGLRIAIMAPMASRRAPSFKVVTVSLFALLCGGAAGADPSSAPSG